jgi:hypothetical protein
MRKVDDYLKNAQECRTLARNMAPGEQRDQLLNMAETWELLAHERRRELEKQNPDELSDPTSRGAPADAPAASPESQG